MGGIEIEEDAGGEEGVAGEGEAEGGGLIEEALEGGGGGGAGSGAGGVDLGELHV